ncbi:MAG: hypothetical protein A2855_00295 [Candidatus Liptonbacteria bacterium RIFCSPHIGHO2_01_FULL_57_28]|uniref:Uncharacterized protein n=1 Tax=Candidatus Liptonbacteria bacterium RIFCSPHIGHO2_01_FULL_57_28 TaxID=1798647 RepID=A0A1G2C8J2_9BACT|nr:MAG: hypothetical protein A2855_00295 [Candidatus Liptonbacteria bacterium RIFCSPHIGHO2_01_FULL_57_28]
MDTEELKKMVAEEMGVSDLAPEMQEQIIDQFTQNALKRITISLYERLPEDAKAEFVKLGEANNTEGLLDLFKKNVPDLDAFIRDEVKDEVSEFKKFQTAS